MGGSKAPYVAGSGRGGGKSAAEMKAESRMFMDSMPTTTRCAFCNWTYSGTAYEGRELAKGHRRAKHPEVKSTRRRQGLLTRHSQSDDLSRSEGLANARKVAESLARLEDTA
jgi:hypothetical protein